MYFDSGTARDGPRGFSAVPDVDSITRRLWLQARGGDRAAYRPPVRPARRPGPDVRAPTGSGRGYRASVESADVLQDAYLAAQAFVL